MNALGGSSTLAQPFKVPFKVPFKEAPLASVAKTSRTRQPSDKLRRPSAEAKCSPPSSKRAGIEPPDDICPSPLKACGKLAGDDAIKLDDDVDELAEKEASTSRTSSSVLNLFQDAEQELGDNGSQSLETSQALLENDSNERRYRKRTFSYATKTLTRSKYHALPTLRRMIRNSRRLSRTRYL